MSGYLLNMATIFEDFVTVALSRAFAKHGGVSRLQYEEHLDMERRIDIRPDFVWLKNGEPRAVADAKYKAEKPSGFPNADFYPLLAYCSVLGLDEGHLVYVKGEHAARTHHVRGSGVCIVTHALDVQQDPEQLLRDISSLADAMARGSR